MNHYEDMQQNGMQWETLSEKMKENLMKEMVAFKMVVTKIEAKAKLSQNKSEEDFHSVVNHLQQGDIQAQAVADDMKKLKQ
jgi:transcriptional regulator